jgi:serine/threonine-protein kinase
MDEQPLEEENPATRLIGTIVADRYRLEQLLGEGGMGAVYRAQHIHMQKDVALKVLHQSMSSNQEVVKRFEREAVAAAKVMHPNVAGASDFGRLADGSFYLVLEYIRGQSLGDLIEETGVMEPGRACRIAVQILSALSAAHNEGIVHRDLKPENVMLPKGDHEGDIVKVLDFGMAKMQQAEVTDATKLTMHGAGYGTPGDMAPELAAGTGVVRRGEGLGGGVVR